MSKCYFNVLKILPTTQIAGCLLKGLFSSASDVLKISLLNRISSVAVKSVCKESVIVTYSPVQAKICT